MRPVWIPVAGPLLALCLLACIPGRPGAQATPTPTPTPSAAAGRLAGAGVAGTIVSTGQGSMTVQDRSSGKEVKVTYDAKVPINGRGGAMATAADLKVGSVVIVRGKSATNGTVKADSIMLGPQGPSAP